MFNKIAAKIALAHPELATVLDFSHYYLVEGEEELLVGTHAASEAYEGLKDFDLTPFIVASMAAAIGQTRSGFIEENKDLETKLVGSTTLLEVTSNLVAMSLAYALKDLSVVGSRRKLVEFSSEQQSIIENFVNHINDIEEKSGSTTVLDYYRLASEFIKKSEVGDLLHLDYLNRNSPYTEYYDSNYEGGGRGETGEGASLGSGRGVLKTKKLISVLKKLPKLPQFLARFISGLEMSIIDAELTYEDKLVGLISPLFKDDFSLRKPKSSFYMTGVLEPTLVGKEVRITFALDYSGSISDDTLSRQLGAVDQVLSRYTNYKMDVIVFSEDVRKVTHYGRGRTLMDVLPEIGENIGHQGGTNFDCVFQEIDSWADRDTIDLIILVSGDGAGGPVNLPYGLANGNQELLFLFENNSYSCSNMGYYKDLKPGKTEGIFYNRIDE